MAYYNPHITGLYNPYIRQITRVLFTAHFAPPNIYCLKLIEFQNTHREAIGNAHHDIMPWNWIQHQLNKSDCPTSRLSIFFLSLQLRHFRVDRYIVLRKEQGLFSYQNISKHFLC